MERQPTVANTTNTSEKFADYLYNPSSEINGLYNGNWGLMRAYEKGQTSCLAELPPTATGIVNGDKDYAGPCPGTAQMRYYNVIAVAAERLPDQKLVYNTRFNETVDENALVYFGCDATPTTAPTVANAPNPSPSCTPAIPAEQNNVEPFVLQRASAIQVTLSNGFGYPEITTATVSLGQASFDLEELPPQLNHIKVSGNATLSDENGSTIGTEQAASPLATLPL